MRIELLTHGRHTTHTGIGRYVHGLVKHLGELADVELCQLRYLPLSNRISPLGQLPVGIENHLPGSIVHFPQIMGCAMMLYRPYHPSVATVHDLGFLELPEEWGMFDPVGRQMLRLSLAGLKRVDRIVADSAFTRRGVMQHLGMPEERVVTVYPAIDHKLFRPISDARELLIGRHPRLAAIASPPWLLYVGSELPRKKIGTLLQVVAQVREEIPEVRLIKVGSAGGERFRRETLRAISELGLENHVLIFEGISDEHLPLFYSAADLFVTASKLEGFGLPVLEAMACGAPVVCSGAGALPEVFGDAGLLVEPCHTRSFAEAVIMMLGDRPLCRRLVQQGQERSRLFAWEQTAAGTAAVYHGLLDRIATHSRVRARDNKADE